MNSIVGQDVSPVKLEATFKLKATPDNVRIARELAAITLISWALNYLIDPAKLIVSELFTNGMEHGGPGKDLRLLLGREEESVAIGVWDSNPDLPQVGECDLLEESGRGLYLVAALADAHDAYRVKTPAWQIVWARLNT
jgi:serine/threonine-protein kinase RsbW